MPVSFVGSLLVSVKVVALCVLKQIKNVTNQLGCVEMGRDSDWVGLGCVSEK
jgi:hypothetical protein